MKNSPHFITHSEVDPTSLTHDQLCEVVAKLLQHLNVKIHQEEQRYHGDDFSTIITNIVPQNTPLPTNKGSCDE